MSSKSERTHGIWEETHEHMSRSSEARIAGSVEIVAWTRLGEEGFHSFSVGYTRRKSTHGTGLDHGGTSGDIRARTHILTLAKEECTIHVRGGPHSLRAHNSASVLYAWSHERQNQRTTPSEACMCSSSAYSSSGTDTSIQWKQVVDN